MSKCQSCGCATSVTNPRITVCLGCKSAFEIVEKKLAAALAKIAEVVNLGEKQAYEFDEVIGVKDVQIADLERQVKAMKNCDNCDVWEPACNAVGIVIDFEKCWKGRAG